MKKMQRIFLALLLGLATAISVSVRSQDSESSSTSATTFSLSIRATPSTVKLGNYPTAEVTITNTSAHDLLLPADLGGSVPPFWLHVWDSNGNPVRHVQRTGKEPSGGSFMSTPIKTRQAVARSWDLKKEFAITKPGTYTVQAELEVPTNATTISVKSNKITFEIVP
jgi:hypothetical protein